MPRRSFSARIVVALVLLPLAGSAQSALSISPQSCVFRPGDNPAWAATALDESAWQPAAQFPDRQNTNPFYWVRCRLTPSPSALEIAPVLQISGDFSYELFVDGQRLGAFGNIQTGAHIVGVAGEYESPLFAPGSQPILVALRITETPTHFGEQVFPRLLLGDRQYLRGQYAIDVAHRLDAGWITWLCYTVIAGAGLFFFTLYWFDRTQTYLLWASFTWLGLALLRLDEFLLAASIHFPSRIEIVLYGIGNLQAFFYANLFFSLAGRKLPRWFRFIVGFLLVEGLLIVLASFLPTRAALTLRYWTDIATATQVVIIPMFVLTSFAPLVAFWPVWKIQRSQAALVLVSFFWMVMDAVYLGLQMPGLPVNPFFFLRFQAARSVAIAATVVALTLLLVQRLRTTNRERAALAGEMQAAREIQRLLVPPFIDMAPGMRIEAVYLPAKELGGDFYRCRILPSGAQRLLLGDVSGKGAAAALTAAMLLGAAEGHDADSPASLLQHLNAVLLRSRVGGFATCLCAEVSPQGLVTLANAGHLAPYRNGDEIPLDSGLPLGITLDSPYTESSATLAPSETLTFISDGVVEARTSNGDLFGFERTRSISSNSAERIAHAAQQFGQQDDITVLTLTFAPAPVSAGVLHA